MSAYTDKIINMRGDFDADKELIPSGLEKTILLWTNVFVEKCYDLEDLWKFTVIHTMQFCDYILDHDHKYHAWYFTCGSDASYPFQDSFAICYAASEEDAVTLFRQRYPRAHENFPEGVANCSWIYPEGKWKGTECQKLFGDMPTEVIFAKKNFA